MNVVFGLFVYDAVLQGIFSAQKRTVHSKKRYKNLFINVLLSSYRTARILNLAFLSRADYGI